VVGPYEVVGELGSGGMGTVYLARDSRLRRDVALKIMHASAGDDPRRLQRFLEEARAAGALSHPNILAVYDVATDADPPYLVSELVDGVPLRQELDAGPLPLARALDLAVQMADGLAAAHQAHLVHGDFTPANVMVTRAGRVKIVDFGLARLVAPGEEEGPGPVEVTASHAFLGTPAYASPEQARGAAVDFRSDLFSFGVVVYEMIAGCRVFERATTVETLAAILHDEPPALQVRTGRVPAQLRQIVQRCLAKGPDQRYAATADLHHELRALRDRISAGEPDDERDSSRAGAGGQAPLTEGGARPDRRRPASMAARAARFWPVLPLMAVGAVASGLVAVRPTTRTMDASLPAVQFEVPLPPGLAYRSGDGMPGVSPDGRLLAFVAAATDGQPQIHLRAMGSTEVRPLPGTAGAVGPFWAPDSRRLGYFGGGKLQTIAIDGGPPSDVCEAADPRGGTWGANGLILFAAGPRSALYAVPAGGGEPRPVTRLDGTRRDITHRYPFFLPNGRHFIFLLWAGRTEEQGVYVGEIGSDRISRVLPDRSPAQWAGGHLVFVRRESLMAQPFDLESLKVTGVPRVIASEVARGPSDYAPFAGAAGGQVAFVPSRRMGRLTWIDRAGRQSGDEAGLGDYSDPALSPDGRRIAAQRSNRAQGDDNVDVWVLDEHQSARARLTVDGAEDVEPVWSPDGQEILFRSNRSGTSDLYRKRVDASTPEVLLLSSPERKDPTDWASSGDFVLFTRHSPSTEADIWQLPLDGDRRPTPLVSGPGWQDHGVLSPDGRWLAYDTDETGARAVFVLSLGPDRRRWMASRQEASEPRWRADGRELFYVSGGTLMAVSVARGPDGPVFGVPQRLFDARLRTGLRNSFVPSPDGRRFLVRVDTSPPPGLLNVAIGWQHAGAAPR
jgi:Tol biopolymer transport system component